MKSPASILASKRRSSSTSSTERTVLRSRSSLGCWSIACVYIARSLLGSLGTAALFGPLVDHAARFADQRAFDRIGRTDAHRSADADHRLDAPLQHAGDLRAVDAGVRGQQ